MILDTHVRRLLRGPRRDSILHPGKPLTAGSSSMIRNNLLLGFLACGLTIAPRPCLAQHRWWMDEPVRLVQTNLRETDSGLDPVRLVGQVADFPANSLLFGCGGVVAHYPTEVKFHSRSPHLPSGRDLFGETLREAHRRGIRV